MSWPADGKPRFVLVHTSGHLASMVGGGTQQAREGGTDHRTFAVLDRAFCHREVFFVRSEDSGVRGRKPSVDVARAIAEKRLAELNGTEAVAA